MRQDNIFTKVLLTFGTLLRREGKVRLWPVLRGFFVAPFIFLNVSLTPIGCALQDFQRNDGTATPAT
jgi:hypothetical protein